MNPHQHTGQSSPDYYINAAQSKRYRVDALRQAARPSSIVDQMRKRSPSPAAQEYDLLTIKEMQHMRPSNLFENITEQEYQQRS